MWYDRPKKSPCFECTGCGACCKREGEVYMTDEELDAIFAYAKAHGIELDLTHIKLEQEGVWSIPIPKGGACPLLDADERCSVHPVKPWQCRAYPFWPEIMTSERAWREEADFCEGMDRGPEHDAAHIDAIMRQDPFLEE